MIKLIIVNFRSCDIGSHTRQQSGRKQFAPILIIYNLYQVSSKNTEYDCLLLCCVFYYPKLIKNGWSQDVIHTCTRPSCLTLPACWRQRFSAHCLWCGSLFKRSNPEITQLMSLLQTQQISLRTQIRLLLYICCTTGTGAHRVNVVCRWIMSESKC